MGMTSPLAYPLPVPQARDGRSGSVRLLLAAAFTACLLGWLCAAVYAACLGLGVL